LGQRTRVTRSKRRAYHLVRRQVMQGIIKISDAGEKNRGEEKIHAERGKKGEARMRDPTLHQGNPLISVSKEQKQRIKKRPQKTTKGVQ